MSNEPGTAAILAEQVTWGEPQPHLTPQIEACACSDAVRAGLFLLNGDWVRAHEVSQSMPDPVGAHWHALVHRHEPDYANSKYWLRRVGPSPIYPALAQAARKAGQSDRVAPGGIWDAIRFTDCFAAAEHDSWTRPLDALELRILLQHCLQREP